MPRRLDETPVRRGTGITDPEPSPGTPRQGGGGLYRNAVQVLDGRSIQEVKFTTRLRRFLRLLTGGGVTGALGDLTPVLAVNRFGPEDYFPDEERYCAANTILVPGAGNLAQYAILNPATSDKLVVVEDAGVTSTINNLVNVSYFAGVLPTALGGDIAPLDGRLGIGTVVTTSTDGASAAVPGTIGGSVTGFMGVLAGVRRDIVLGVPLLPGQGLLMNSATVGVQTMFGLFRWREMRLPAS